MQHRHALRRAREPAARSKRCSQRFRTTRRSSSAATSSPPARSLSETLERLRALGDRVHWLRGNADRELTPGEPGLAPAELLDATRARADATSRSRSCTRCRRRVQIGRVLYCHATPRNDLDIFTERTPEERIAPLFADVDADVVVCGHTHMQFDRTIAGKRVSTRAASACRTRTSPARTGRSTSSIGARSTTIAPAGASVGRATRRSRYFTERGL